MDWKRKLHIVAWWTSSHSGLAKSDSAPQSVHFAAPPELGGAPGRWTPEELFLGALASSLTTTFHAMAGNADLEYTDLEIQTEGILETTGPLGETRVGGLLVRPRLTIAREEDRGLALALMQKSQALCPILCSLAAKPRFEIEVEVGKLAFVG